MLDTFLEKIIKDKINNYKLSDKITHYLVYKKKRGTYQALKESQELEKKIEEMVVNYIKEWFVNELIDGPLKVVLDKEIESQVILELSSMGYNKVVN